MKGHPNRSKGDKEGFTLVEAVVAIALVGIGITSTIAALTRANAFASVSRNSTGAYATVMNQIDAIQSNGPFNPQKGQIPAELVLGTHPDESVPIYRDPVDGVVVPGIRRTQITDASGVWNGVNIVRYAATVTVTYTYLNRSYAFTMDTIRVSDE